MARLTTRGPFTQYNDSLRNLRPFKTSGSLEGTRSVSYGAGYLPRRFARIFNERYSKVDYVVYSYATPIAWHDSELGWYLPEVIYSVTTSRHQSGIFAAVKQISDDRPTYNVPA